jgi:dihydrofolate reductase
MGKVILGLTMSLDGFINDRNGSVESLYPDFVELRNSESLKEDIRNTGAVIMGRRSIEMGDPDDYADNYEFQAPIFVLTNRIPDNQPRQNEKLTFTFVTDGIESAIKQAKVAAHDKDVTIIGGASIARQCLLSDLLDEIHIDIMPILLCGGLRLFEDIGERPIMLEKISVVEQPVRTQIKYRILKQLQRRNRWERPIPA